jgi:heme-degrading monooxygenase HmoA
MTFRSQRQVVRAPGFLGSKLLIDRKHTYWTLTMWEDERAMKAFRGSGAHAAVMPKLV